MTFLKFFFNIHELSLLFEIEPGTQFNSKGKGIMRKRFERDNRSSSFYLSYPSILNR